jgi:hypothetical protein
MKDHSPRGNSVSARPVSTRGKIFLDEQMFIFFVPVEDRTPTDGYEATREDAMIEFAKSWRRE